VSGIAGRFRLRIAAGVAGLLTASALIAGPLDTVRDCADKASPATTGIESLSQECPELEQAIRALSLEPTLVEGWREQLNRDALRDLAKLSEDYAGAKPGSSPSVASLPEILRTLAREQAPPGASWWDAFRAWVQPWLQQHSDTLQRLGRWLENIGRSATLVNVTTYSLVALVLVAALAVIFNEWKANAARGGRGASGQLKMRHGDVAASSQPPDPDTGAGKLAALLRLLVQRLMQTGRLKSERSLTHRELVSRSLFDDESQRAVFAEVAGTAESLLYGAHAAQSEQLDRVLAEGRALLGQLSAASTAR
jgi:hypothetical protein